MSGVVPAPVVAPLSRSPRQVQLRRLLRGYDVRARVVTDPKDIARLASAVGAHLDVREF